MKEDKRPLFLEWRFITRHKKNTIAIFLTFTMIVTLVTAVLILVHTNDYINYKTNVGSMDEDICYVQDISKDLMEKIRKMPEVIWYGIQEFEQSNATLENGQTVLSCYADHNQITADTKVIEGRLPQKENEVVAERWALLDIGVNPTCGTTFKVHNSNEKKERTYRLVGIIADMKGGKLFNEPAIYLSRRPKYKGHYIMNLRMAKGMSAEEMGKRLMHTFHLKKDLNVQYIPKDIRTPILVKLDLVLIALMLAVSMIIFYGIYRIALMSRLKEFGVLRAVGMKRKQIRFIIVKELYLIYLASIPIGSAFGYLCAIVTGSIAKQNQESVYQYNKQIVFHTVIPWLAIGCFLIAMAVCVGFTAYIAGRKISRESVITLISHLDRNDKRQSYGFLIKKSYGQTKTLLLMGGKYIVKDIKTSIFVILTISLGITIFTGLSYQKDVSERYREDTKEFNYLQGQYFTGIPDFEKADEGISRACVDKIKKMKEVKSLQTAAGMPVRVISDPKIKTDKKFFKNEDKYFSNGYSLHGNDGTDQVYKTVMYGYNPNALKHLGRYVLEGNIPSDGLKEDQIILVCKRRGAIKKPNSMDALDYMLGVPYTLDAAFTKAGKPVMEYHAGDKLTMKYRADFKTSGEKYQKLKDKDAKYIYKTYKVAAIAYFNYLPDCTKSSYPILITSDKQLQKICPDSHVQTMYINGRSNMSEADQKELEIKIWKQTSKFNQVKTKSVIGEIKKNELLYRKQKIYVTAVVLVTLVIVLLNMYHSLAYRMKVRTREISMLRAIGMSVRMIQKMMLFENGLLVCGGILVSYLISRPLCKFLYDKSHMYDYLHEFCYNYGSFAGIAAVVLAICLMLSLCLSKSWKSGEIMERLNQAD